MFLANENFPQPSIAILRENGYTVKSIQDDFQGMADEGVIQLALEKNLIILTFDKDYGELIFRYAKNNLPSVVFFRNKGSNPEFAGLSLINLLTKTHIIFSGAFTVIEDRNIRQRFYNK